MCGCSIYIWYYNAKFVGTLTLYKREKKKWDDVYDLNRWVNNINKRHVSSSSRIFRIVRQKVKPYVNLHKCIPFGIFI